MADIGAIVPAATRVEPSDVLVGNVVEHGGDTRDIPITALRRSNANHDIESINNSVRLATAGVIGVQLAQNGDFSVHTNDIFIKKASGFAGFGTVNSVNRVGVSGGLAVGAGFIGATAPTNGAIIEGKFAVGINSPDTMGHFFAGSAGAVTANIDTVLTVENNGPCFVSALAPENSPAGLYMGSGTDNIASQISYDANANAGTGRLIVATSHAATDILELRSGNNVSAMTIESDQGILFSSLKSGATQAASTAAANELWFTASHATLPDNVILIGV